MCCIQRATSLRAMPKPLNTLIISIIILTTLDMPVFSSGNPSNKLHVIKTNLTPSAIHLLNNTDQLIKFKFTNNSSEALFGSVLKTKLKRFNRQVDLKDLKRLIKRPIKINDLGHTPFSRQNSLSSCLTPEQRGSLRTALKISQELSFLHLLSSLDSNYVSNISETCSFSLRSPNALQGSLKPLLTHNITALQRLSAIITRLFSLNRDVDLSKLGHLINYFKLSISPDETPLKIVLRNNKKLLDALEATSWVGVTNSDKKLYQKHYNLITNSQGHLSILCKGGLGPLPESPVIWEDATYDGVGNSWGISLSVPVLECNQWNKTEMRGFIKYNFTLDKLNTHACTSHQSPSILQHHCPPSLQCEAKEEKLHLGAYVCKCPSGWCVASSQTDSVTAWIHGRDIEAQYIESVLNNHNNNNHKNHSHNNHSHNSILNNYNNSHNNITYRCVACHSNHTCDTGFNVLLRGIPLAVEALSLTICIALLFALFKHRKTKMMKASIWLLLEALVLGCILIHCDVVLRYFEATATTCMMSPWFRELGFTIVYGSLILKIYKVLAEFQSRKAHRAQVRDKELQRGLLLMVVVVVGYMAAWTAVTIDTEAGYYNHTDYNHRYTQDHYRHNNDNFSDQNYHNYVDQQDDNSQHDISNDNHNNYNNHHGYNDFYNIAGCDVHFSHNEWSVLRWNRVGDRVFTLCRCAWWDVVIETAEVLFLAWGLRLCYRARTAPSIHHEHSSISFVIANELVVSVVFHVIRHWLWLHVHSDLLFLIFFIRTQLTISLLLAVIIAPKLWFLNKGIEGGSLRVRGLSTTEAPETQEAVKLNAQSNGEIDVSEIRIEDMSADDIRTELKRVYTQLQIYKTKSLRHDNPHISKRKGGKKQTHRRFSLQTFHNKHKRQPATCDAATADAEASKTPEESTNSADRGSLCTEDGEAANRRSSFKRHHSKSKV